MTTLAANSPRAYDAGGNRNAFAMIASDIIYEGGAVGRIDASGHARPLNAADKFGGFAAKKADNAAGAAAAIRVETYGSGRVQLAVAGAVITDVAQPIYATDDDTFVFSPVGAVFIGLVHRFVSAGIVIVDFGPHLRDPYGDYSVRELISGNKTLDAEDCGKLFWVDTDAVFTLPAAATPALPKIVNGGAFGDVLVTISPASGDSLEGPDITAADDKDVINTKATARRGDMAVIGHVDAVGYTITELVGTWGRQV